MKYTYPVIFEKDGKQISVSVPDLPGCFTCADTIPQAVEMAADALAMMLAHYEDNKQAFSPPSPIYSNLIACNVNIYFFFLSLLQY